MKRKKNIPCDVCKERPKAPGRGRRRCDQCEGLCKYCLGPTDDKKRCADCTRTRNRERYQQDPEYAEQKRIRNKLSLYGITQEQYDALGNSCRGCGATDDLMIDHNHTTGRVRGRLCRGCNTVIGMARENTDTMRNLIKYIEETR